MTITSHPALQAFLARHSDHSPVKGRIAVFDCDGTLMQGDIGEAMLYHQIERLWFKVCPAELWPDHPSRDELRASFMAIRSQNPEERAENPEFSRFADMVLSWYFGQIQDGAVAKACTDIVRLLTGFSIDEVQRFAEESASRELESPLTHRILGGRRLPKGIRYIQESVDLLHALRKNGFQVWVVSGSNRWSVEPVVRRLGIPPERVIGITLHLSGRTLTPEAEVPVPIRENKVAALKALTPTPPLVVASDSKNDIPLFLYARELKVRINSRGRDTNDFFRAAGVPLDDSWIIVEKPTSMLEKELPWQMRQ